MEVTVRDMDHKRAYDRERMARLYAEGETWWQRHPVTKAYHDSARQRGRYRVRLCGRILAVGEELRASGWTIGTQEADLAKLDEAKAQARPTAARWFAFMTKGVDLAARDAKELQMQAWITYFDNIRAAMV